jgi:hypothetical protein
MQGRENRREGGGEASSILREFEFCMGKGDHLARRYVMRWELEQKGSGGEVIQGRHDGQWSPPESMLRMRRGNTRMAHTHQTRTRE